MNRWRRYLSARWTMAAASVGGVLMVWAALVSRDNAGSSTEAVTGVTPAANEASATPTLTPVPATGTTKPSITQQPTPSPTPAPVVPDTRTRGS
jgi:hypothetical protein